MLLPREEEGTQMGSEDTEIAMVGQFEIVAVVDIEVAVAAAAVSEAEA